MGPVFVVSPNAVGPVGRAKPSITRSLDIHSTPLTFTVLSRPADTIRDPSALKAAPNTQSEWISVE